MLSDDFQEQEIFERCHRVCSKHSPVRALLLRDCQIDGTELAAVLKPNRLDTSWCFQQIAFSGLIDGEVPLVGTRENRASGWHWPLLIERSVSHWPMPAFRFVDDFLRETRLPEKFTFFCTRIRPNFLAGWKIGFTWTTLFKFSGQVEVYPFPIVRI